MRWANLFLLCVIGCGGQGTTSAAGDPGTGSNGSQPPPGDMAVAPVAAAPHGGPWVAPPPDDPPVSHAAPSTLSGASSLLTGTDIVDVSTDEGGGIWAVSASKVFYFPPGASKPFTYDQDNGLARGWRTYEDPYFKGTPESPAVLPVTFASVGGATAGEAIVGNMGAIADKLQVDPKSGTVQNIENLAITTRSTGADILDDHKVRVIGTLKVVTVLDGAKNGTAYLGGYHGFYALHGLKGDCGCNSDFEEHIHYNGCDSSGAQFGCYDGEVYGLAMNPSGDLWAGDRHWVQLLPQRTLGPNTGFMEAGLTAAVDTFPGVRDEVHGLAVDANGGVWVASDGNGLAYITSSNQTPMYWSAATTLPMNHLHGAAVDQSGDLWVGTNGAGVARYNPASDHWTYYTAAASGLADDEINTIYVDQFSRSRRVFIATHGGINIYEGP